MSNITEVLHFITPFSQHRPTRNGISEEKLPNVTPVSEARHIETKTPSHLEKIWLKAVLHLCHQSPKWSFAQG
jgi:hypothetical protein